MIADFNKKQKRADKKNKFPIFCGVVLCLIVLGLLAVANIKMYQKKQELNKQLSNLKSQAEEIKKSNSQLEEGILKADNQEYIEKVAREQLDLQKENEKVTVFLMPKTENNNENPNHNENWLVWLGNFWGKLFGKK